MCMLHTYTYMTYMGVFSFKQLQVSKYMQSKIVGGIAHVLKSSITVDSAKMKTLIHFCIMEYTSWQFLAHCHPNTGWHQITIGKHKAIFTKVLLKKFKMRSAKNCQPQAFLCFCLVRVRVRYNNVLKSINN
nr:uncharacterized protein LOC124808178 [Hydra vulgaris]